MPADLPRHLAIIMDGNGRWARARGLPRLAGHRAGARSLRRVVRLCRELGMANLTLFAFSSENWRRPRAEVRGLMALLEQFVAAECANLRDNGIELATIGDIRRLPTRTRQRLLDGIDLTAGQTGMRLNLALSYGARDELTRVVRSIAQDLADRTLRPEEIEASTIGVRLDTRGLPDPDLVIRTGGEHRLSNFLLWQAAYAELYFTDTMWPDFGRRELLAALEWYRGRTRRFGGVEKARIGVA
jgi:undecaprenyl diphosphate synthase